MHPPVFRSSARPTLRRCCGLSFPATLISETPTSTKLASIRLIHAPKQPLPTTSSFGRSSSPNWPRPTNKPMKKQLNSDAIANELRGNSAFFPRYKEARTPDPVVQQTPVLPEPVTTPLSSPHPVTAP